MYVDQFASRIINVYHSIMRTAVKLCVADCIAGCVWLAVPQLAKQQRIGNQINAAMVFAWADFVDVHGDKIIISLGEPCILQLIPSRCGPLRRTLQFVKLYLSTLSIVWVVSQRAACGWLRLCARRLAGVAS